MSISLSGSVEGLLWQDVLTDTAPPYTIVAWGKVNTVAAVNAAAFVYYNGNNAYVLRTNTTPRVSALTRGYGAIRGEAENQSIDVTTGAWLHFAATFAGGMDQRAAYLGGTDEGTDSGSGTVAAATNVGIGYLNILGDYAGLVAEVAIWRKVLDSTHLVHLGAGLLPEYVEPDDLIFHCSGRESTTAEVGGAPSAVNGSPAIDSDHPIMRYPWWWREAA